MRIIIIIIIMENKNINLKTCMLIDVAVPANRNVMQKEAKKKLKYKIIFCPCIVNDYNPSVPTNAHTCAHIYSVCICWY
jgi:hypothetical protein